MPLPPYIASKRAADAQDQQDYQTIYARNDGAVGDDVDPGRVMAPAPSSEDVSEVAHEPDHEDRDAECQVGPDDRNLVDGSLESGGAEDRVEHFHDRLEEDGHHDEECYDVHEYPFR